MPAKRRLNRLQNSNKKINKYLLRIILFVAFVLLSAVFIFNIISDSEKIAIATTQGEDVSVIVFDPQEKQIVNLTIPGDTEVNVARNLGLWKIKSVWQLGEDENLSGKLLTETIAKNFSLPIFNYADDSTLAFLDDSFLKSLKNILRKKDSNLNKIKLLRLMVFAKTASLRKDINLTDSYVLRKQELIGGDVGYVISSNESQRILSYFADSNFRGVKVVIVNNTGSDKLLEPVSRIIEVLGVKPAITQGKDFEGGCRVEAKDNLLLKKIASIFNCESKTSEGLNDEIQIFLGEDFSKIF